MKPYLAFQDINQAGTAGVVTFVGGDTADNSLETAISGNTQRADDPSERGWD